jgi:hypothetical protein
MEDHSQDPKLKPEDLEDQFLRERMERWGGQQQASFDPFRTKPLKNKWIAGVLSFLVPGTGQLYLGLMQRGITLMLLLILDIFAIVAFATNGTTNIPLIVLFSLFIPVIYFYNIFDALQQTDKVNGYGQGSSFMETSDLPGDILTGKPHKRFTKGAGFGYVLILVGAVLFLTSSKPGWLMKAFDMLGSSIGAVILILIGMYMFYKESKKR